MHSSVDLRDLNCMTVRRQRSEVACIVVSADGVVQLDRRELDDLRRIVSNAPPQAADLKKDAPVFQGRFRRTLREEMT